MRVMFKREIKISIEEMAISELLAVGGANNEEREEMNGTKQAEFLD